MRMQTHTHACTYKHTQYYFTIGVILIFLLEAVLHMIAYGFLLHPNVSYLRRPIFTLDMAVILFG